MVQAATRIVKEKSMRTLAQSELKSRSSIELGVLHDMFNKAMAQKQPFSTDWLTLARAVDAIQTERRSRLERPWRSAA
jgi:hypothetical protein